MLLKLIVVLVILALALGATTIWRNGVPWGQPPGFWTRIAIYTMRNEAHTEPRHVLPELRPQAYAAEPKELYNQIQSSMLSLGWRIADLDPAQHRVHAEITTPLLRFVDDLHVTVNPDSTLDIRSKSRKGRADYGANLGHILDLTNTLDKLVPKKTPQSKP